MFFVYILYSEVFDVYYVGHTDDVHRRILEHNEISTKSYSKKYRPWKLLAYYEVGHERGLAMRIEKYIKKQKNRVFIKMLIEKNDIGFIFDIMKKTSD